MFNLDIKIKINNITEINGKIKNKNIELGYFKAFILSDAITEEELNKNDIEIYIKYLNGKKKNNYLVLTEICIYEKYRGQRTAERTINNLKVLFNKTIILYPCPLNPDLYFRYNDLYAANEIINELKLKLHTYYISIGFKTTKDCGCLGILEY